MSDQGKEEDGGIKMELPFWAPVYEADGNMVIAAYTSWASPEQGGVAYIVAEHLLDTVILGLKFVGARLITPDTPNVPCTVGGWRHFHVLVIEGPLLDEALKNAQPQ